MSTFKEYFKEQMLKESKIRQVLEDGDYIFDCDEINKNAPNSLEVGEISLFVKKSCFEFAKNNIKIYLHQFAGEQNSLLVKINNNKVFKKDILEKFEIKNIKVGNRKYVLCVLLENPTSTHIYEKKQYKQEIEGIFSLKTSDNKIVFETKNGYELWDTELSNYCKCDKNGKEI